MSVKGKSFFPPSYPRRARRMVMDTARGYNPLESQATVRFTIGADDLEEADAIADAKLRRLLKLPQEHPLNVFYKRTITPNEGIWIDEKRVDGEWLVDYEVIL